MCGYRWMVDLGVIAIYKYFGIENKNKVYVSLCIREMYKQIRLQFTVIFMRHAPNQME